MPYMPDLVLCDFCMQAEIKTSFEKGAHCQTADDVKKKENGSTSKKGRLESDWGSIGNRERQRRVCEHSADAEGNRVEDDKH